MLSIIRICFVAVLLAGWSKAYAAELHKCTGPDGSISFSDTVCPSNAVKSQQIAMPQSQPSTSNPNDYWSVENQARRLDAQKAQEQQEAMNRRLVEEQLDLQRQNERQIEANQEEAKRLHRDSQDLYDTAARSSSSKRKALLEQAKSIERQADVLMGRRQTSAPTDIEVLQQKMDEATEQARRAENAAHSAAAAARANSFR